MADQVKLNVTSSQNNPVTASMMMGSHVAVMALNFARILSRALLLSAAKAG